MFWAFIIANPVVGPVRLNRDMALMGFSFATALAGVGILSLDARWRGLQSKFSERRDIILIMIRLGLAYALVTFSLFFGGPLNTSLNTAIPLFLVFVMGFLLAVGVIPRWVPAAVFLWLFLSLGQSLAAKGVFWGLEGVKRELGLMAACFVYLMAGPDHGFGPGADNFESGVRPRHILLGSHLGSFPNRRKREGAFGRIWVFTLVLLILGGLLMFPPIFEAF